MTLKLIHYPLTRSFRVAWLLHELGIDAEIETRKFVRSSLKEEAYRKENPLGKTPVFFEDGERIVESVAIVQYVAEKYGKGALTRKLGDDDYAAYLQWLQFSEGGMGSYVNMLAAQSVLLPEDQRVESMKIWAQIETKNCMAFLEDELDGKDFLLGEFSICDIGLGYLLMLLNLTGNGDLMTPNVAAYYDRLKSRDAWGTASALQPPK